MKKEANHQEALQIGKVKIFYKYTSHYNTIKNSHDKPPSVHFDRAYDHQSGRELRRISVEFRSKKKLFALF